MELTSVMIDLEGGTASLGLFGLAAIDDEMRPPHVQITVNLDPHGTAEDMRRAALHAALDALAAARATLERRLS